jgi:hypothetical protein
MLARLRKMFLRICAAACVLPLWCAHAAVLVDDTVLPWPGGVVHWAYNPADQSPLQTTDAWVATMADAMARWQAVCRVQFVYDGLTDLTTSKGSARRPSSIGTPRSWHQDPRSLAAPVWVCK